MSERALSSARGPLIVRLCNMVGDVVLGLPALYMLREQGWQLHLYGKGWAPRLLAGERWACTVRAGSLRERVAQLRTLRAQLRAEDPHFDRRINTLVMPNSFSSALEPRLAGLRPAGYAGDGRSLLLAAAWRRDPPGHALEGFWGLACRLSDVNRPPPERVHLAITQADQDEADRLLAAHSVMPGFICLVPYAAGDVDGKDKRWPDFPAFTANLAGRTSRTLVTCPGPGEEDVARSHHPSALCLPGLALGVYLGVLKRASLVISNDTGPAHMAAAVGTPVLSALGPTRPEQWRPWGPDNRIVQGSQGRLWPTVDEVLREVMA